MADYKIIHKYIAEAVCMSPLHIGSSENGKGEVLIHPVSGIPFIQASSIAGMMRSISESIGNSGTSMLFGEARADGNDNTRESGSRLKISDGQFDMSTVKMELRPRVAIDPVSGTVGAKTKEGSDRSAGQKFDTEYIAEGSVFSFNIYLFGDDDVIKEQLEGILAEISSDTTQIGAMKTNGNGFLGLKCLSYRTFDMTSAEDRNLWADEESDRIAYEDIVDKIRAKADSRFSYTVKLHGKTEGPLLVKDVAVTYFGSEAPVAMNIRNSAGDYIVPGSSLKGVLRSRMTHIAKIRGCEHTLDKIFGYVGKGRDTGLSGQLTVKDTVVGFSDFNDNVPLQHRIHIDKFTGGVMHGQLFSEKNVSGDVCLEMMISRSEFEDVAAGLLILALRDLAVGMVNIGSGYNIGKGYLDVNTIEISHAGKSARIDFASGEITDNDNIISGALNALNEL